MAAAAHSKFNEFRSKFRGTFFDFIYYLLVLTFPTILIAVGFLKHDACPSESRIPLWLIAYGLVILANRLFAEIVSKKSKAVELKYPEIENETKLEKAQRELWIDSEGPHYAKAVFSLTRSFKILLIIIGIYLLFASYDNSQYCHWAPYSLFIFAVISSILLLFGLILVGFCLLCIFRKENDSHA